MKGTFMPKDMKTMILPDSDEIMNRLTAAFDESHAIERFYPIIAQHEGRELNATGIVMMLMQAIDDYTKGMPGMMKNMLLGSLDMYVYALVDDPEVKADAILLITSANARFDIDEEARNNIEGTTSHVETDDEDG